MYYHHHKGVYEKKKKKKEIGDGDEDIKEHMLCMPCITIVHLIVYFWASVETLFKLQVRLIKYKNMKMKIYSSFKFLQQV